ncbi:MAG: GNAT family N-acetyltransferase, partial [Lachnospiraceae bacterium]|nr:GNAT family N-acetyltransferase [Lachnospiraceae bacterium]
AGMHFDGILRASKRNKLGIHDSALYSILRSDLVTKKQYEALFLEMNPGYFEREYVQRVSEDEPASEMFLRLQEFDEKRYEKAFPENVTFGYYDGDLEELRQAVEKVVPHWVNFFGEKSRVYCGFVDGKIASFCLIEDFGEHEVNGQVWKIGGPGCVGTVPEYRDRGIGLTMVKNVTKILRDELYDQSYIHYTYETKWYGKLGYKTFLSWCGKGFV